MLIRPGVQRKTNNISDRVLPVDLAAAYACYHDNLVEQRKLEQKLHIIDIETKHMKRDFRQQREILERELKKTETDYWNCHRVFSAETLITESDSYRKRFYTGPQPTKAKLPRRTLDRLSQLVRSLQAEEDLETVLRFQRCARYARRSEVPDSVSSLTLTQENSGEFDSWEMQRLTELRSECSTDSIDKLSNNTREKRIRSAPSRVASGKKVLGECNARRHSAYPRQYSPKKLDETSRYSTSQGKESSGNTYCDGRENPSTRLAWVEKENVGDTVDEAINDPPSNARGTEQTRDRDDLVQSSLEHQTPQSSLEQSCDNDLLRTPSQSSGRDTSHQQHLHRESCSGYLQSNETDFVKTDSGNPATSQGYIASSAVEERERGDVNLDQFDSAKGATTPSKGWELIKIAFLDNKMRDDNEIRELTRRRRNDEDAKVAGDKGRGLADNYYNYDNYASKKRMRHRRGDHKAQGRSSEKMSIALPKCSLHGLSSHRKSLTPRDQQKLLQNNRRCSLNEAKDEPGLGNNSAKENPQKVHDDAAKNPEEDNQSKDAQKKRKVSIFKRKCLSEALFSGQEQIESQVRNRVQGFLGTVENADQTIAEETGDEERQ